MLGAILSAQGAGPTELPPGSENQKPLVQFVERGQCPTSWQHLPGGTQVICRVPRVPRSGWVVNESLALTTNVPCQACHQRDPQRESRQQGRPWCSRVRRRSAQRERPGSAGEVWNHHPHSLLVLGTCAYRGCCWADWPVPQGPTASTKAAPPVALGFSGPRPCADSPASFSSCLVGLGWFCPHMWVAAPAL